MSKRLYHGDLATHTALGVMVWAESEQMLRDFLLKQHKKGVSVTEALLIIHETAGAAAQHVANRLTNEPLERKRRRKK